MYSLLLPPRHSFITLPGKGSLSSAGGEIPEAGVGVDPASWSDYLNELFDPMFDSAVSENVTAVEGHMAHLVCRVNNLGTKTVRTTHTHI